MFLLILLFDDMDSDEGNLFTFHNVSINSDKVKGNFDFEYTFTFHNVSINSIAAYVKKYAAQ